MTLEELMKLWRNIYDEKCAATAPIMAEINELSAALEDLSNPFDRKLHEIEAEIEPLAMTVGATTKLDGVEVSYRSGYPRVSYDWKRVDVVLGILRDALPETAKELDKARKETYTAPKVSVKAA